MPMTSQGSSTTRATPPRRVALLVHTASDWSRQVLRGVANFAAEHGHWDFHVEPRGFYENLSLPRDWSGDGVILRLTHPGLTRALRRAGLPAVNVSWLGRHTPDVPKVVSDEGACGRLAAQHLLEKSFRSFGYVGPKRQHGYADLLGREFNRCASEHGYPCSSVEPIGGDDLGRVQEQLRKWARQLPKPVGVLVWNGATGRELTVACAAMGLEVPEEVSVVCSEHDPLMSAMAPVPLSNIDQAPGRVGYEAAALLDRMLSGDPAPHEPVLIPPLGVIHRQSSDTTAVEDPVVATALQFIRDHVRDPINVVDIQKSLSVSRRVLELRFVQVLDRTPAAEIRRARLERVRRLLIETDLSVAAIARQCGFNHAEVLSRAFRREMGLSPSGFRARR